MQNRAQQKRKRNFQAVFLVLAIGSVVGAIMIAPSASKEFSHAVSQWYQFFGGLDEYEACNKSAALADYTEAVRWNPGNTAAKYQQDRLQKELNTLRTSSK